MYQLWGVNGTNMISLGTFEGQSKVVTFHVDPAIKQLAVTEEEEPGSSAPSQEPIGSVQL